MFLRSGLVGPFFSISRNRTRGVFDARYASFEGNRSITAVGELVARKDMAQTTLIGLGSIGFLSMFILLTIKILNFFFNMIIFFKLAEKFNEFSKTSMDIIFCIFQINGLWRPPSRSFSIFVIQKIYNWVHFVIVRQNYYVFEYVNNPFF